MSHLPQVVWTLTLKFKSGSQTFNSYNIWWNINFIDAVLSRVGDHFLGRSCLNMVIIDCLILRNGDGHSNSAIT